MLDVFDRGLEWFNGLPDGTREMILVTGPLLLAAVAWIAKQGYRRHRRPTAEEWKALANRFRTASTDIEAVWQRYDDGQLGSWGLMRRRTAGTRDVEHFVAIATEAERLSRRAIPGFKFRRWRRERTPLDRWLDVAASLVD